MTKLKAAFFGTPEFSVSSLEFLQNCPDVDLRYVITMPDRPAGRGKKLTPPPVATYAKDNDIALFQTPNINKEEEFLKKLQEEELDFILVIAFAQFLGSKVLDLPKMGCFNIHTSLLPKYRGAAPIQYAILNGDQTTGVTIQKMVKKMDAGDLVFERTVSIDDDETGGELFEKLQKESAHCLNEFIPMLLSNNLNYNPQDDSLASFAPTIKKQDGLLNFSKKTSQEIKNQVRAFQPWPGTFTFLNGLRLKINKVSLEEKNIKPGILDTSFGTLLVGCKEGSLRLSSVQLEGKKACSDSELINGLKNKYESFEIREP